VKEESCMAKEQLEMLHVAGAGKSRGYF